MYEVPYEVVIVGTAAMGRLQSVVTVRDFFDLAT